MKKRLGMYLIEAGLITQAQLDKALDDQKVDASRRLGEILAHRGWVAQQTIEYLMENLVWPQQWAVEKQLSYTDKKQRQNLTVVEQASLAKGGDSDSLLILSVPSRELEVHLSPRKTMRFLLFVVLGLVLASLVGQFSVYFLPDYPLRDIFAIIFNVNGEQNIPSLYSASALLLCSILLAIITYAKKVAGERYVLHWRALSIIFVYLSLDEFLSLHERSAKPVRDALHTSGFLQFAWVIPAAICVLICLLVFLRFVTHLPAKTRRLFLIAGTIFVSGALGIEMVDGYYASLYSQDNIIHKLLTTIEEFLEMIGIVIFIYALLSYISSHVKGVSLRVNIIDDRKQRRSA